VINYLPTLEELDGINVSPEERKEVANTYSKKSLFYTIKIKSLNRLSKSILTLLKTFKSFFIVFKNIQILFFSTRIKMLNYIEVILNIN